MMVHSIFVKLWPFLGLWQFVSLYSKRWDSFKMAVDDFRWICLCLVETANGVHDGQPEIILLSKVMPTYDLQLLKSLS